jgi:hypothetical protein
MKKAKLGISKRAYARRANVDHAYVMRLCKEGKLPVLPDGTLDPVACDRARAQNTQVGGGPLRSVHQVIRQQPEDPVCICLQCGGRFRFSVAVRVGRSPDGLRFCSDDCAGDAAAAQSRVQTRRWRAKEMGCTLAEAQLDETFDWVGPDMFHDDCHCTKAEYLKAREHR